MSIKYFFLIILLEYNLYAFVTEYLYIRGASFSTAILSIPIVGYEWWFSHHWSAHTCQRIVHVEAKTLDLLHGQTSVYEHPAKRNISTQSVDTKNTSRIHSQSTPNTTRHSGNIPTPNTTAAAAVKSSGRVQYHYWVGCCPMVHVELMPSFFVLSQEKTDVLWSAVGGLHAFVQQGTSTLLK